MGESAGIVAFGDYELDFGRRELRRGGQPIPLQPTPLRLLLHLAEHRDRTVSRRELLEAVWPGVVVGDEALTTALAEVRRAVGDDGDVQRVIRTRKGLGYRFVSEVVEQAVGPAERPTLARRRGWLAAALVLVAAGVLGAFALNERGGDAFARDLPPIRSLAVLPLANLSGDPDQEYFADGMTETLIAELAKLPGVRVISRTSVMQFKGTKAPLSEIARTLAVDGVIEGSVMRAGDEVRITAQLVDARRDEHVWASQYERDLAHVFEIQTEVARAVAKGIELTLSAEQAARFAPPRKVDPRAIDAYLRGRQTFFHRINAESLRSAIAAFDEAVQIEPSFAAAHAFTAAAYTQLPVTGAMPWREADPLARAAALRAIAFGPELPGVYTTMGVVHATAWEWEAAERAFLRGLELSRNGETLLRYAMFLPALGRCEEAIATANDALAYSPTDSGAEMARTFLFFICGRLDDALHSADQLIAADPSHANPIEVRFWAHRLQGRMEEAVRDLNRIAEVYPGSPQYPNLREVARAFERAWRDGGAEGVWRHSEEVQERRGDWLELAVTRAALGNRDGAFAALDRAYNEHTPRLEFLLTHPGLAPLRSDPRFAELARRMNLPAPDH